MNTWFYRNTLTLLVRAFVITLLCFTTIPLYAAQVTLQWEANTPSPEGYRIFQRQAGNSYDYSAPAWTGITTTRTLDNLIEGDTYYFVVRAYQEEDESGNSSEVEFTATIPTPVDIDGDGYSEDQGDCNDSDPSINPGATDLCADNIDQDCNDSYLPCASEPGTKTAIFGDTPDADYTGTVQDTFININRETNEISEELTTYTWPADTPANAVLIKFDLSGIPTGAIIQSAILTLYQTGAGGDPAYDVSVHKIINHKPDLPAANGYTYDGSSNWTANSDCYNGIPLAQADIAPAEDINNLDQSLGYKEWNIADMVQGWIDEPDSNFGLLLNSDAVANSNSHRTFAASEANEAAQRPTLELVYRINDPDEIDDDQDGHTENQGDCNDDASSIYPGANEICGDGIDQDCDGSDLICPEDIDHDNDGYTENQGDCSDSDPNIYPGANEICGDGIDQDCSADDLACPVDPGVQTLIIGDTPDADITSTVQDTYLNINEEVNVSQTQLNTYTWPADTPANAALIKLDLSQIPEGAQIHSATLTLYQTESGGDASYDVSVHKVINHNPDLQAANGYTYDGLNTWTGNEECYNSIPLAQADIAPAEDVNRLDMSFGPKHWDITKMVQDWISDSAANYGLMLNSDTEASSNSYRFFAANEASDPSRRPKLEIAYSVPVIKTVVFANTPGADYTATVQDTYLNINEEVNVSQTQLNTYTWPENSPANAVLIKIDLKQIPTGALILNATLSLYQTEAGGDASYDVPVHRVVNHEPDLNASNGYTFDGATPWSSNDSCYNNIPLAQSDIAPAEDVNSLDTELGYKTWDVTGMIQEWVLNPATNFGLILNSDAEASSNSYRSFAASEASEVDRRPSLSVTYLTGVAEFE